MHRIRTSASTLLTILTNVNYVIPVGCLLRSTLFARVMTINSSVRPIHFSKARLVVRKEVKDGSLGLTKEISPLLREGELPRMTAASTYGKRQGATISPLRDALG